MFARQASLLAAVTSTLGLAGACGDPLLPSDFSGPPAAAVSGNVVGATPAEREATRPRLALEWLVGFGSDAPAVVQQAVDFERSQRLQNDFDIDLRRPTTEATFANGGAPEIEATGDVRMAVAKIVYFDDHVPDGKLDRTCTVAPCDELKAVSAPFVVYLAKPLTCPRTVVGPAGGVEIKAHVRLSAGFHYFTFEGGVVHEIGAEDALQLDLVDPAAPVRVPAEDLAAFAGALVRALGQGLHGGC